jgi:hypothetical protein
MTVRITRVSPLDSPDQRTEAALRSLRREIASTVAGVGEKGDKGGKGEKGDKGDPGESVINLDGGDAFSTYGGVTALDCGGA